MPCTPGRARRRLTALALTVALSGAAGFVTPAAGEHGCECPAHSGAHECECAFCALRLARQAADRSAPPCHRAAARETLSERRAREARPCLKSGCGTEPRVATHQLLDPFLPPPRLRLEAATVRVPTIPIPGAALVRPRAVELPPPRVA